MSIRRQLALGISLLMLVVMGSNLLVNIQQLKSQFEIIQEINLGVNYVMEPYHRLHAFILAQYYIKIKI